MSQLKNKTKWELAYWFPIFVPSPFGLLTGEFAGKLSWFTNVCNRISEAADKLNCMFCENNIKKKKKTSGDVMV